MTLDQIARYLFAAALALTGAISGPLSAQDAHDGVRIVGPGEAKNTKQVHLVVDKSTIVDLPVAAADVVITNPDIADAAVQTSQRMIFRGIALGQTNAYIFDHQGNEIVNLEIQVTPDIPLLNSMIAQRVPGARVTAEAVGTDISLNGFVSSSLEATQIVQLAQAFTTEEPLNFMSIDSTEQLNAAIQ